MKIVDVNVMISAVNVSDARHEQSRSWIDAALVGNETVGFTWIAMLAFLRLMTKVGLFPNPCASTTSSPTKKKNKNTLKPCWNV